MALSKIDVANMLTGATPVANGGTGLSSGTSGQFLKFTGSTTLASNAVTEGITVSSQWRLTSSFTNDASPIASNWEEVDTAYSRIGSTMTESSGVFTFPSTGIYLIHFQTWFNHAVGETEANLIIDYTANNGSNWAGLSRTSAGEGNDGGYSGGATMGFFDVTDTSNYKVRFVVAVANTGTQCIGDSGYTATGVTFVRIGDT